MADQKLVTDLEIDRIAQEFEQALRRGLAVNIEEFAGRYAELGGGLVRELLLTELEYRESQQLPVDWNDYARRFPLEIKRLQSEKETPPAIGDTSQNSRQDSVPDSLPSTVSQTDEAAPLTPLDFRDYALETILGGGGQGDVYRAQQLSLGRRVAVKLLKPTISGDPQSEQRFLREARTLAQTSHPQIVTIHGIGRTPDGKLFLVMEFIEGNDLAKQIQNAKFEIRRAVEIVIQIADAIEHAHSRGVIHRDLKPSNVLWHDVRGAVVTDFGLAKDLRAADTLTLTEQMLGTPTYMAPEQAHRRFGEISERTDVYGLAATLYALLTSHSPVSPGPIAEVLQNLTNDDPVADPRRYRSELPAALCVICLKGLAKFPRERYSSIPEFARDLQSWLKDANGDDVVLPPTVLDTPARTAVKTQQIGEQFGRFKLIVELTHDSTRKVFRAEDETGRPVILKFLPPEWMSDRKKRIQFRQEVLLACEVSHPCLAKVIEAGSLDDAEFLALEFLEGESLDDVLLREGRLSELRAVEILQPIAEALHLIHGAGVIYRDLRPKNILLTAEGRPFLAEVRISEQQLSQSTLATGLVCDIDQLPYFPPEFWLSDSLDVACDVYMLGATLYAMVTGKKPFSRIRENIQFMIDKKAGRYTPPQSLVADLSDPLCELIADALHAEPTQRPASAQVFADRLRACTQKPMELSPNEPPADPENLLHAVWDQFDPELQDAFSLAYNKKRRTGSSRISTRDLFEAMARLGTGPLKQVFHALPSGSLPEPADASIPIDRSVLHERPLLSDCVQESLGEFRKLAAGQKKVSPVDLFVDVAKHGHGASVVKLREHGVDPEAIERIVQKLGLKVIRREKLQQSSPSVQLDTNASAENYLSDDNVQFSVYRPKAIPPESWQPLLAFAHLSELPSDASEGTPDPVAEVQRQAEQILGTKLPRFQSLTTDSSRPIPKSSELTFVPSGDGLTFNPPQRSFLWQEPVHREEFRFKAGAHLDGQIARGRLSVYLGLLLIAEVSIVTRVDRQLSTQSDQPLSGENRAFRFRRIFACVSRKDRAIFSQFQRYAQLLKDTFLTSQNSPSQSANDVQQLICSADVFQLYWSNNALQSSEMEREWKYALSLKRTDFIRSLYWEEPFPTDPGRSLPPPELLSLGFQRIPISSERTGAAGVPSATVSLRKSIDQKLQCVRGRGTHYLELLNGEADGKIFRLDKDRMTIGRSSEADLCVETNMISRFHAQVIFDRETWFIEDLGSGNGTWVNGYIAQGRMQLRDGDKIHIGCILFRFRAPIPATTAAPSVDSITDSPWEDSFESPTPLPHTASPVGPDQRLTPTDIEVEDHGDGTYTVQVNGHAPYQPGDVVGQYCLIKVISLGGFGKAYLARLAEEQQPSVSSQQKQDVPCNLPQNLASDSGELLSQDLNSTASMPLTPEQRAIRKQRPSSAIESASTPAEDRDVSEVDPLSGSRMSVSRWLWAGLFLIILLTVLYLSGWRPW